MIKGWKNGSGQARVHATFAEDLSVDRSTPDRWLITARSSSSKDMEASGFCGTCAHTHVLPDTHHN